jgi:Na+/proline symporter
LIVRDFYVPLLKPTPENELRISRLLALPIGFLPLLLVFLVPQVLHLSFFTRALRLRYPSSQSSPSIFRALAATVERRSGFSVQL